MAEDIIVGRNLPAADGSRQSAAQMALYEVLRRLPSGSQFGLIFGLSAALALGVGLILWAMKPTMVPVFTDLEPRVMLDISEQLRREQVEFEIDYATRTLLVPADRAGELKARLNGFGENDGYGPGWGTTLEKETAPGTSTDRERARFLYALQNELSRSIADMANIERARVHLAVPKQTAFLRARDKPTASVVVFPSQGRTIPESQVEAIRRLVAAGVT
ncbi:MAG: hypothetical protein KDK91_32560, partial [Gammaproteobacteria bacterium]|nr:hypothetical protein [Gammaproteobacteria bacterium]